MHVLCSKKKINRILTKKIKSQEIERQLQMMLKPRPDIKNFSRTLFTAQSIVLVCIDLLKHFIIHFHV
jgi:hypothetical protein